MNGFWKTERVWGVSTQQNTRGRARAREKRVSFPRLFRVCILVAPEDVFFSFRVPRAHRIDRFAFFTRVF